MLIEGLYLVKGDVWLTGLVVVWSPYSAGANLQWDVLPLLSYRGGEEQESPSRVETARALVSGWRGASVSLFEPLRTDWLKHGSSKNRSAGLETMRPAGRCWTLAAGDPSLMAILVTQRRLIHGRVEW